MSHDDEETAPGTVIETRELWSVRFREDGTYPWKELGTERADWAAVLRTWDFHVKNHPDVEHEIIKTDVARVIEDPERLRAMLPKDPAEDDTVVQSA